MLLFYCSNEFSISRARTCTMLNLIFLRACHIASFSSAFHCAANPQFLSLFIRLFSHNRRHSSNLQYIARGNEEYIILYINWLITKTYEDIHERTHIRMYSMFYSMRTTKLNQNVFCTMTITYECEQSTQQKWEQKWSTNNWKIHFR